MSQPPELRRAVSRGQVVALALNDVVGSGIYLLPAAAAALLGPMSLVAVVVAGLAVLLVVLCFAEASSRFEGTGGAYLYAREAFGDLVGFEVGWMTWLARVASVAALSAGFAQALSYLVPAASAGAGRALAIAVPLAGLIAINVIGVRAAARTAVVLVVGKLVPLGVFVAAGIFVFSPRILTGQSAVRPDAAGLGEAALLLLFAYAGFENTPAPAGEFRRPRRDVPLALLIQIGIVTLLYASVQLVALGTLPGLGASATPLADAAGGFLGGWGGWLLTAGAAVSILGTAAATVLAGPRYLYALARDGYGPRWLASVHPHFRTPAAAILLLGAVALPLALFGSFAWLVALSVIARLATYLGTAAAVPVLRRKMGDQPGTFRLPGGPAIPIAAVLISLALAASAGKRNLIAAAVALLVGLGIYALRRKDRGPGPEEGAPPVQP